MGSGRTTRARLSILQGWDRRQLFWVREYLLSIPIGVDRRPAGLTRITVDGTPSVTVDLALGGSSLPGADATAARVVNSIAAVCAAGPGIYGALDLAITPAMSASARR
jgi:hypothetical protein